ncbi:membrane skeletal protein IMC1, putative [Eimeria maxima]|uniref:Membrane skeletal protein IMC1, putative n=1 Tax=Eimeria maxima TaxID=5804 RepID=U6M7G8_EIMMA|nr:membrane skeletal protein IMC1, putative [Eimeria maxima]CDJ59981.1 membrane skeletal protein IMC1, putative [Eimeria maxima]
MIPGCSDCCAPGGEGNQAQQQQPQPGQRQAAQLNVPSNAHLHATAESVRSVTLEERTERERAVPISEQTERQWVAITAYQPVDTVVKTVEVPVVRTIETYVPKVVVEEKIVEVPKFVPEYVEKIVEVPEVKVVDKIVELPRYEYQYKYVHKIETQENIIQRPKYETKYVEKIVEVPQVKEVVRYQDVEEVEEVIRYVPKGQVAEEEWEKLKQKHEEEVKIEKEAREAQYKAEQEYQQLIAEEQAAYEAKRMGLPSVGAAPLPPAPRLEQVFKPKVVKTVEIQKHVPVSVDVPVPYMVPKPIVVPVQVPVLKFRDHFVPVPVRRRVVPRIRWTNEVYEVECIKEKPYLQVQDIIKPVPCDVEIKVHEFVEKAQPINPAELSQADVHAMWMRVNADLAEKRKEELGEKYPYVQHPEGTVFGEPGSKRTDESAEGAEVSDPEAREGVEPLALHPGHPLNMTYLQNEWIKKETTATHEMYTPEWFEAHQKAMHNLTMQYPTQVQLSAEQAARLQQDSQTFGEAPWVEVDEHGLPKPKSQKTEQTSKSCSVCSASCGGSGSSCCTCGGDN